MFPVIFLSRLLINTGGSEQRPPTQEPGSRRRLERAFTPPPRDKPCSQEQASNSPPSLPAPLSSNPMNGLTALMAARAEGKSHNGRPQPAPPRAEGGGGGTAAARQRRSAGPKQRGRSRCSLSYMLAPTDAAFARRVAGCTLEGRPPPAADPACQIRGPHGHRLGLLASRLAGARVGSK